MIFSSCQLTTTVQDPRLASPGLIKGNTLEKFTLGAMFFIKMPRPELSSRSMTILQFGHLNVLLPPIFVWRNPQAEQVCVVYSSPTIKRLFLYYLAFSSIRRSLNLHGKISARLFGNFTFPSPVDIMFLHHVSGWKFRQENNIESSAQMNRSLPMCFINEMFYFWKQFQSCAF